MQLSMTPFLLALELGFCFFLAGRSEPLGRADSSRQPAVLFCLWLTAYGLASSILGYQDLYVREDFLRFLPGLWLQLVTVSAAILPILLFSALRQNLRRIVDATPLHWFAYFQALRITALGTAAKTLSGEFPLYFELLVGGPDLLFGLSALWVAARMRRGDMSPRGFLRWNLLGAFIIVPAAPILLQMGLPGPLQVFTALPDARAVYSFPMSVAPMMGVPLFVLVNLWVAWRLWERAR